MAFVDYKIGFLGRTDDIVQETLFSIHKGLHTYNPEKPLKSWALAIAQNRICDFLRKQKRHVEKEIGEHLAYETTAAPEPEKSDHPQAPYLQDALQKINEKYRQAIDLTKLQGLTIPEAAQQLGVTESTVKMRCHRGYKILRKQLERVAHEE